MRSRKTDTKRLGIKMFLCSIYLIIITVLFVASFKIFKDKSEIVKWQDVKSSDEYTYLEISKMSEKFAYYENENIGLHFVIEEEETGLWHTYVIAINENSLDKYKNMIDYTYGNSEKEPDKIKVYGYPSVMSDDLKEMIVHNINNFLPESSGVKITNSNLERYLTNCYLDATIERPNEFNVYLFTSLLLLAVMIGLFIFTIFDKDKIVDETEKLITKKNK